MVITKDEAMEKYFIKRFINLHEKMSLDACDQTTEANHRYGARQKATTQNLHLTQG
jgi:type IV secretory pathway component VirB8